MSEFPRLWPEDELPDELRPSRGKGALEALLEQPLTFDAPAQAPQVPQEPAERRTIRRMLAERAPQAQPVQAVQTPQTPQQGEGAFARVVASPLTFGTEQQPEDDDPTGYGAPGASLRWVQPPLDFGTGGIVSTVPEAQTQRRSIRRMLAERTGQPEQPPVYAPPANPPEAAPPPQPLGPLFGGNVGEALRRVTQGTAEALGFGRPPSPRRAFAPPEAPPVYAPPATPPEAEHFAAVPFAPLFQGDAGESLRQVGQGTTEALGIGPPVSPRRVFESPEAPPQSLAEPPVRRTLTPTPPPSVPDGTLDTAQRNILAGAGDIAALGGIAAERAGAQEVLGQPTERLIGAGERLQQLGEPYGREIPPLGWHTPLDPRFWEMLRDPHLYATVGARNLPLTLALMGLSIPGFAAGSSAGAALGLGALGRTVLGAMAGTALSRPLEGAMEAAGAYQEAKSQGLSEEQADAIAQRVFENNLNLAGIDAVQLAATFARVPGAARVLRTPLGRAATTLGRIGADVVLESQEEGVQEEVTQSALETRPFDIRRALTDPAYNEARLVGGLMGAAFGAGGVATDVLDAVRERTTADPRVRTIFGDAYTQALDRGLEGNAAVLDALDALAQTPEGRTAITRAVREMAERPARPEAAIQEVTGQSRLPERAGPSDFRPEESARYRPGGDLFEPPYSEPEPSPEALFAEAGGRARLRQARRSAPLNLRPVEARSPDVAELVGTQPWITNAAGTFWGNGHLLVRGEPSEEVREAFATRRAAPRTSDLVDRVLLQTEEAATVPVQPAGEWYRDDVGQVMGVVLRGGADPVLLNQDIHAYFVQQFGPDIEYRVQERKPYEKAVLVRANGETVGIAMPRALDDATKQALAQATVEPQRTQEPTAPPSATPGRVPAAEETTAESAVARGSESPAPSVVTAEEALAAYEQARAAGDREAMRHYERLHRERTTPPGTGAISGTTDQEALVRRGERSAPTSGPVEWAADLARLQAQRFKSAGDEITIQRLQATIAANPARWQPGQGVGYQVTAGQINRGFRIRQVDPETKLAEIVQVADTGLTSTGGDTDRIQPEWVPLIDLRRDRRYDTPAAAPAPAAPTEAPSVAETSSGYTLAQLRKAGEYVDRLIHTPKKEYAQAYLEWVRSGRPDPDPVVPKELGFSGGQAIRQRLDALLPESTESRAAQRAAREEMAARSLGESPRVSREPAEVETEPLGVGDWVTMPNRERPMRITAIDRGIASLQDEVGVSMRRSLGDLSRAQPPEPATTSGTPQDEQLRRTWAGVSNQQLRDDIVRREQPATIARIRDATMGVTLEQFQRETAHLRRVLELRGAETPPPPVTVGDQDADVTPPTPGGQAPYKPGDTFQIRGNPHRVTKVNDNGVYTVAPNVYGEETTFLFTPSELDRARAEAGAVSPQPAPRGVQSEKELPDASRAEPATDATVVPPSRPRPADQEPLAGASPRDVPRAEPDGQARPTGRGYSDADQDVRRDAPESRTGQADGLERGDVRRGAEHGQPDAGGLGLTQAPAAGETPAATPRAPARKGGRDFVSTPAHEQELSNRASKDVIEDNLAALELLASELEAGRTVPTREQQVVLARYSGWGDTRLGPLFEGSATAKSQLGLHRQMWGPAGHRRERLENAVQRIATATNQDADAMLNAMADSRNNAFFTTPGVVRAMWSGLERLGLNTLPTSRVLEPSAGAGRFFTMQPAGLAKKSIRTAVELDTTTGEVLRRILPSSDVRVQGFEATDFRDNTFDVIVSNVPFGRFGVNDPRRDAKGRPWYPKEITRRVHNYFFAKAIDKVRPGGVVMFITSRYTLDGSDSRPVREWLAERADLLAAFRLPGGAFSDTKVVTDILVLQKRAPGQATSGVRWVETATQQDAAAKARLGDDYRYTDTQAEQWSKYDLNEYYVKHPAHVLGTHEVNESGGLNRAWEYTVATEGDTEARLRAAMRKLPKDAITDATTAPDTAPEIRLLPPQADQSRAVGAFVADGDSLKVVGLDQNAQIVLEDAQYTVKSGKNKGQRRPYTEKEVDRIQRMMALRDTAAAIIKGDAAGEDVAALRTQLDALHVDFATRYGPLNHSRNRSLFRADPAAGRLRALEQYDPNAPIEVEGDTEAAEGVRLTIPQARAIQTDMFRQSTMRTAEIPEHVDDPKDALLLSLNESGALNFERMGAWTGLPEEQLTAALSAQGLIYRNPDGGWEHADEYLSGYVKDKLRRAREAVEQDPAYVRNVTALEAVQPADVPPSQISVGLGVHWVPPSDYAAFVNETLGGAKWGSTVSLSYTPATSAWLVQGTPRDASYQALTEQWGTGRLGALDVLQLAMNNRPIRVVDVVGSGRDRQEVLNENETAAAKIRASRWKQAWKQWVWQAPERADRLGRYYNDHFNNVVKANFDGSHLQLAGSNPNITLYRHQKDSIWRILQEGNVLLAHAVGFGKSWVMIGTAMELRRLGLSKKNVFVVPNHLVGQFAQQFYQLYAGANVLTPEPSDFTSAENRQALMARMQTSDWDGIIMAQSQFTMLPLKPETQAAWVRREIAALTDALAQSSDPVSDKQLRARLRAAATKLAQLTADIAQRSDQRALYWEDLGVGALFVDEADMYKNLPVVSSMGNIRGLPKSRADRAIDMDMKVEWLRKENNGRGIVFATGTPVSNTIAELWVMMHYLQPDVLESLGLGRFDAWATAFATAADDIEQTTTGSFKEVTRFIQFLNMPELSRMFQQTADVRMAADAPELQRMKPRLVDLNGRPSNRITITSPASDDFLAYMDTLIGREEIVRNRRGRPQKGDDILLSIATDARLASLDVRLRVPGAQDHAESKINKMVEQVALVHRTYAAERATQLVFINLSTPQTMSDAETAKLEKLRDEKGEEAAQNYLLSLGAAADAPFDDVYHDVRRKLVARGIKAGEIAFIHQADTVAKRVELFKQVDRGQIRVLLGSTEKMGAGMNVQQRLVAAHFVTPEWRPRDREQGEGRLLRQGNQVFGPKLEVGPDGEARVVDVGRGVHVFQYATESSYDGLMLQTLRKKLGAIRSIMQREVMTRSVEDVADDLGSAFATGQVRTIGNPLVLERIALQNRITLIERDAAQHQDQRYRQMRALMEAHHELEDFEKALPLLEQDAVRAAAVKGTAPEIRFGAQTITDLKNESINALAKHLGTIPKDTEWHTAFVLNGFEVRLRYVPAAQGWHAAVEGASSHPLGRLIAENALSASGLVTRTANLVHSMPEFPDSMERSIGHTRQRIAALEESTKSQWAGQDELDSWRGLLEAIEGVLSPPEKATPEQLQALENALEEARTRVPEDTRREESVERDPLDVIEEDYRERIQRASHPEELVAIYKTLHTDKGLTVPRRKRLDEALAKRTAELQHPAPTSGYAPLAEPVEESLPIPDRAPEPDEPDEVAPEVAPEPLPETPDETPPPVSEEPATAPETPLTPPAVPRAPRAPRQRRETPTPPPPQEAAPPPSTVPEVGEIPTPAQVEAAPSDPLQPYRDRLATATTADEALKIGRELIADTMLPLDDAKKALITEANQRVLRLSREEAVPEPKPPRRERRERGTPDDRVQPAPAAELQGQGAAQPRQQGPRDEGLREEGRQEEVTPPEEPRPTATGGEPPPEPPEPPAPPTPPERPEAPRLPRELAGAKPRYGYGSKQFELDFANDLDKAAYILAQTTRSKADAQYLDWFLRQTGMNESEARRYGERVREAIKRLARDAESGGVLRVPDRPAGNRAAPRTPEKQPPPPPRQPPKEPTPPEPPPPPPPPKRPVEPIETADEALNTILEAQARGYTPPAPTTEIERVINRLGERLHRSLFDPGGTLKLIQEEIYREVGRTPTTEEHAYALYRAYAGRGDVAALKIRREFMPHLKGLTAKEIDLLSAFWQMADDANKAEATAARVERKDLGKDLPGVKGESALRRSEAQVRAFSRVLADRQQALDGAVEGLRQVEADLRAARAAVQHAKARKATRDDTELLERLTQQRETAKVAYDLAKQARDAAKDTLQQTTGRAVRAEVRRGRIAAAVESRMAQAESARTERAATKGAEVGAERIFSGGVHAHPLDEAKAALRQLAGDETAEKVFTAAEGAWQFMRERRRELYREGLLTDEGLAYMEAYFPNYDPTILLGKLHDVEKGEAPRVGLGQPLFSVADNGIRRLGLKGTPEARMKPVEAALYMTFKNEAIVERNRVAKSLLRLREQSDEVLQLMPEVVSRKQYREAKEANGGEAPPNIVAEGTRPQPHQTQWHVWEDGVRRDFLADTALLPLYRMADMEASLAMKGAHVAGLVLGVPLLRKAAVQYNPFYVPLEFVRGTWDVLGHARWRDLATGRAPSELARAYLDLARQAATGREIPDWDAAISAGAGSSAPYAGKSPEEQLRHFLREVNGRGVFFVPQSPKELAALLGNVAMLFPEGIQTARNVTGQAPKLAAWRLAKHARMSDQEAMLYARNMNLDPELAAPWVRVANQVIPFAAITVRGTAQAFAPFWPKVNGQWDWSRPALHAVRILTLFLLPAALLEAYNRKQYPDDYANVNTYLKDNGVVILLPFRLPDHADGRPGRRALVWLPMPQEYAWSKVLFNAVLDQYSGEGNRTWEDLAFAVLRSTSPVAGVADMFAPVAQVLYDLTANYDSFRNEPIVPPHLVGRPPEEQYKPHTGAVARALGKAFKVAPIQIDYLLRGIFAGWAKMGQGVTDAVARALGATAEQAPVDEGIRGPMDLPIVGGVIGSLVREAGEQQATDTVRRERAELVEAKRRALAELRSREDFKRLSPAAQQKEIDRQLASVESRHRAQTPPAYPQRDVTGGVRKYLDSRSAQEDAERDALIARVQAWRNDVVNAKRPSNIEMGLAARYEAMKNPLYKMQEQQRRTIRGELAKRALAGNDAGR